MKRDEKKPTASQVDSCMLISGDELNAANAVCVRLMTAAEDAEDFVTATAKDGFNPAILPAPSLQTLTVLWSAEKEDLSKGCKTRLALVKLASVIADMRIALTAAYRDGDPAKLLSYWLFFVYRGAIPLLQKKHSIALAEGNRAAAQTFAAVFNGLPPRDKIDHPNGLADIEAEARRLAQSTTPDEIFSAISRAFRQDAEATDAINSDISPAAHKPVKNKARKRYPKDKEAIETLAEAARRKGEKAYSGDSSKAIILRMIEEPQSKWTARILHGKLKSKASGQVRTHNKPLDKDKAADNWGKYLSAYLRDHPSK